MFLSRAIVLFTAMPVHECAHGFVADRLGDDTPRSQGRLSLNPFRHLDLFGSLLLIFAGFGWAKPVQVDPRNFRKPKRDMALTSLAGPLSNVLFALVLMVVFKLLYGYAPALRHYDFVGTLLDIVGMMISINMSLAVFNLLPIPPLDGSKIYTAVLPDKYYFQLMRYERYIALALMALILFTDVLTKPMNTLATLLLRGLDLITAFLGRLW